jgi:mono/diheme cytochrome c family protein
MKSNRVKYLLASLLLALAIAPGAFAAEAANGKDSSNEATVSPIVRNADADAMRVQGEQRFRANCGRCHAAPQKFPPRVMATVVRHMRVRATITADDMRLILFYMTQ